MRAMENMVSLSVSSEGLPEFSGDITLRWLESESLELLFETEKNLFQASREVDT
jgi:hypothetical protein